MKTRVICLGWIAMLVCLPASMAGTIYKWKDANGRLHIGDQPPDPSSAQQIFVQVNTYKGGAVAGRENALKAAAEKGCDLYHQTLRVL